MTTSKTNSNQVALVTGASRGIGKTIALGLSTLGYRVALMARSERELADVAEEIRGTTDALIVPVDLSDETAIGDAVSSVLAKWGKVDILVNNAGIFELGTLKVSSADLDRLYKVNLRAPFLLTQAIVPEMKKQRSGYIFNISSVSGVHGFAGYGAYASSKFGLVGLSEALFNELAAENIKVTALCPAWVDTEMAPKAGAPVAGELMIQPSDIMKTISWLLSLSSGATVSKVIINCTSTVS